MSQDEYNNTNENSNGGPIPSFHPWKDAADIIGMPEPMACLVHMELVDMIPMQDSQETLQMVIVISATPAGVQTVFMDLEGFNALMEEGRTITRKIFDKNRPSQKPSTHPSLIQASGNRGAVGGIIESGKGDSVQKAQHDKDHAANLMDRERRGMNPF